MSRSANLGTKATGAAPPRPVRLAIEGRIATLTLDRPPLNILDIPTLQQLEAAVEEVTRQQAGLTALVVRGDGQRAFSAGVAIEDHVAERIAPMLGAFHAALRRLYALEVLTIAAVDGHCLGGGMELALTCDLVVATQRSTFGQPEIKLGCFPPVAAVLLPQRIGSSRAMDLMTTGRRLQAEEAERLGLVQRLAPDGELEPVLDLLLGELQASSAAALQLTKKAIRRGQAETALFASALAEVETIYLEELTACPDMSEGVEAFVDKRPPRWSHERG